MKYATAVRNLAEVAGEATDVSEVLGRMNGGDPLFELWTGGRLLEGPDELDVVDVVVVFDQAKDTLPWLALPEGSAYYIDRLRLVKRPTTHSFRPRGYPAWNATMRSAVRFWSARGGTDEAVMEALRNRRFDALPTVTPSADELSAQLRLELIQSRQHLRKVLDDYWDKRYQRGAMSEPYPLDDQLWRAAQAVRELEDTLAELSTAS